MLARPALFVEIVGKLDAPGVDEALKLMLAHRPQPPHAHDLKSGGREAFEERVTVLVREVIAAGLRHLAREMHMALVVEIEKLQERNERGLAHVVGADEMHRGVQLDLGEAKLPAVQSDDL